ncbi:MAG: hypothetical protein NVS4B3_03450 [Gemmatimonadaceae bacterium]
MADRELPSPIEASIRSHLSLCAGCGTRLRTIEQRDREMGVLLKVLDGGDPSSFLSTGVAEALVVRGAARRVRRRPLLAAGFAALVVAGAAAAAVPGSPIVALIARVRSRAGGGLHERAVQAPLSPARQARGIAFIPGREPVLVFRSMQSAGSIRVTHGEAPELRLTPNGPTGGFGLHGDTLIIENAGATSTYELVLPRTIDRITIRVGDRTMYRSVEVGREIAPDEARGGPVIPLRTGDSHRPLDTTP